MLSKYCAGNDTVRASKLIIQAVDPTPHTTAQQLMIAAMDSTRNMAIRPATILASDQRTKTDALHLLPKNKEGQRIKNTPVKTLETPKRRYTMPALLTANPSSCILNTKNSSNVVRMILNPAMPDANLMCFIAVDEDLDTGTIAVLFVIIEFYLFFGVCVCARLQEF